MKKIFILLTFSAFIIASSILQPSLLLAQGNDPPHSTQGSQSTNCVYGTLTALGCIPSDPKSFAQWILKIAILTGGGIAFLLSLFGGLTIILAAGNPEKINQGKETITAAISGLLFIVFSIFLLRFIGYDILHLPGISK